MTNGGSLEHRSSPLRIRRALRSDAGAIAGIHVRSWIATYGKPPSDVGLEADIARRAGLWEKRLCPQASGRRVSVADREGTVTGFVHFGPSPDDEDDPATGHIFSLHVEPELVKQGIGRLLIEHASDELQTIGCRFATLWVVAANQESRAFYERVGWQADGPTRREALAMEGEAGDEVEVVRYFRSLSADGPLR
jgi:GNAT superfamily N-acetyltransferase